MKIKLIFGILVLVLFIVGCSQQPTGKVIQEPVCNKPYLLVGTECCLDKDDNSICDKDEIEETVKEELIEIEESTEEYLLGDLMFDINEITGNVYVFEKDEKEKDEGIDYYYSNIPKDVIIEVITNKDKYIKSYEDFYKFTEEKGYEYLDSGEENILKYLTTDMKKESDFSYKGAYIEYLMSNLYYNFTYSTKELEIPKGKIIEFYDSVDTYNDLGYFQGGTLNVMFKIYCTPNLIVKLRPRDRFAYRRVLEAQKSDTVISAVKHMVEDVEKELLPNAKEILEICPVKNDFFKTDFKVPSKLESYQFIYNPEFQDDIADTSMIKDLAVFSKNSNINKITDVKWSGEREKGGIWAILFWW